jgi:hypothetical protein
MVVIILFEMYYICFIKIHIKVKREIAVKGRENLYQRYMAEFSLRNVIAL